MSRSGDVPTAVFAEAGAGNTDATLQAAAERAETLAIDQLVVATSTGRTALRATECFDGRIIAVTLSAGHWATYCPPEPETIAACAERGVEVLTCTHSLFGGIDGAISSVGGIAASEIIARTYYTICQGAKVAVECVLMAADAGLLEMDREVIGIAGTGGGADTALVLSPAFSNTFFDLRIREIIAKPR
ncbi:MAG: hypothetical protein GX131_18325 [candidate division WS1 bacterium]|jgi:hypothetical protein|nr:hypothetical protein [candidate division WS1 bacterium]